MRKQDEANPVFYLATVAGKIGPSCRLGISCIVPLEKTLFWPYDKSLVEQACLVKITEYLPTGNPFCIFVNLASNLHNNALGQYPATLKKQACLIIHYLLTEIPSHLHGVTQLCCSL